MNTKINNVGFSSILFFTSQVMFLGLGITQILNSCKTGSIISVILGSLIGYFLLPIFIKFYDIEKDLTLFQKLEKLYGNFFGKIINFILFILFLFYFIYTLWSINAYIQNKYLSNTPSIIILILFLIPVTICTNYGIKTISKVSLNLFIITILEIILSFSNLSTHVQIENLKPFFNTPITGIIKNAFIFSSYFLTPAFVMTVIPKNLVESPDKIKKWIKFFYIFSSINFILLFTFIIGVFGIDLAKLYYYPEFILLKKINYFDFIQHIENILSSQWLYSSFIGDVIVLNFLKYYLKHINKDSNYILYLITLICLILAIFIFKNSTIGYNFVKKYFVYILTIPLLILILTSNLIYKLKKSK